MTLIDLTGTRKEISQEPEYLLRGERGSLFQALPRGNLNHPIGRIRRFRWSAIRRTRLYYWREKKVMVYRGYFAGLGDTKF